MPEPIEPRESRYRGSTSAADGTRLSFGDGSLGGCLRFGLFPAALYLAGFALLTYPLLLHFSTHYFADQGDGLQNIWNLWWTNKAVCELRTHPWFTTYLHYPYGTSLLGHTLSPLNAFLAIPLQRWFGLTQAHNLLVIGTFVGSGVTAFWLARYVTGAYWASLVAGWFFTFSSYHFSHAEGHLALISMQGLPLFLLAWLWFLDRPGAWRGAAAALALALVLLSDYYYFFLAVLTGAVALLWRMSHQRHPARWALREVGPPFLAFVAVVLATCGPLAFGLLLSSRLDPFAQGGHPPSQFSLDLLGWIIPGGHWRFAAWTERYWVTLPGVIHESSVHLGIGLLCLLLYGSGVNPGRRPRDRGLWIALFVLFLVLAFGPVLQVWGHSTPLSHLPYQLLERLVPALQMGGVPVRFVVLSLLAGSVLAAAGLARLGGSPRGRSLAAALFLLSVFETAPRPLPLTRLEDPAWVRALAHRSERGAVLDLHSSPAHALYYQTRYDLPQAFGYISRTPRSVKRHGAPIRARLTAGEARRLYPDFGFRYLVVPAAALLDVADPKAALLFKGEGVALYDLAILARLPGPDPRPANARSLMPLRNPAEPQNSL